MIYPGISLFDRVLRGAVSIYSLCQRTMESWFLNTKKITLPVYLL